jgi:hypothetical protein
MQQLENKAAMKLSRVYFIQCCCISQKIDTVPAASLFILLIIISIVLKAATALPLVRLREKFYLVLGI